MTDAAGTSPAPPELVQIEWPAGARTVTKAVSDAVVAANELSIWIATKLDGRQIPRLPNEKRVQLASACHHVAIEHQSAVCALAVQGLYASTTAMVRPTIEACFRGLWLEIVATQVQLDAVGRDERDAFPGFGSMVSAVEKASAQLSGNASGGLADALRGSWWGRLCSYTHTGYQQIGARLTASGLGTDYSDDEIRSALRITTTAALMSAAAIASLMDDGDLAREILDKLKKLSEEPAV